MTFFQVLVQTVGNILDYIEPKFIAGFWNILHKTFDNILKEVERPLADKTGSIQHMLHFLGQSIEYHGGQKVVELPKIINLVIQIIDQDFSVDVLMTVSKIGALLLMSHHFMIDQLDASRLAKKILHINEVEVFESFVVNSIGYSQFDVLIMPDFIKYFERNFSKSTMEILAKIVHKRTSREMLATSEGENNNINLRNSKTIDGIVDRVMKMEETDEFLMACQILPCLMTFEREKVEKSLQKQIQELLATLSDQKSIYLLAVSISTLHNISGSISKSQSLQTIDKIIKLIKNPALQQCLRHAGTIRQLQQPFAYLARHR